MIAADAALAGRTALHLSAHPDDELLGAPATLFALRDAGLRIVNIACGLGRPAQHARRRIEVEEACARANFELQVLDPPLALSAGDDLAAAEMHIRDALTAALSEHEPACVVAPSPHDRHHGHEVVGRGVRLALEAVAVPPVWLAWEFWAMLPLPTLLVGYDEERLEEITTALSAHAGELARIDYARALEARARLGGVLGGERVFGYGRDIADPPFAEVLCELHRSDGEWWAGAPRSLDPAAPLAAERSDRRLGWWLRSPGFSQVMSREPA
jgi:LmbE family N-acetylglucosaminyl deacetylase